MLTQENIQVIYPLSPLQEGIFFHALLAPSSQAYFEQISCRMKGAVNVGLVNDCLNKLLIRHDVLRTIFVQKTTDRPLQIVLKNREIEFYYENIIGQTEDVVEKYRLNDRKRGFKLERDVLVRAALLQVSQNEFEFIVSYHHILMDGWCLGLIIHEFFELYRAAVARKHPDLPAVVPYRTYISWLEKKDKVDSRNYWSGYLRDFTGNTLLPTAVAAHARGNSFYSFTLDFFVSGEAKKFAADNHITMNVLIQTVWGILVARINRAQDVVFGSIVSGRPSELPGVESMIGLFINCIPVRVQINGGMSALELLSHMQSASIESEKHHYFPLAEIQADRKVINHILIFENYPLAEQIQGAGHSSAHPEADIHIARTEVFEQTNYDFNLMVGVSDQIHFTVRYNDVIYSIHLLDALRSEIEVILRQILANGNVELKNLKSDAYKIAAFKDPSIQHHYWRKKLDGVAWTSIPFDLQSAHEAPAISQTTRLIANENIEWCDSTQPLNVSTAAVLMAALKVLLFRYTGEHDIAVAFGFQGQVECPSAAIPKFPLRSVLEDEMTVERLLNLMQAGMDESLSNGACVDKAGLDGTLAGEDAGDGDGLVVWMLADNHNGVLHETVHALVDIRFRKTSEGLSVKLLYDTQKYETWKMDNVLLHVERVLADFSENIFKPLSAVSYLDDTEKQEILHRFCFPVASAYPDEKTIVELFEDVERKFPDNIALVCKGKLFTYREINERANQLAHFLRANYSVRPDDLVGILSERNENMIIGILGILKSGAGYLPLDPGYPKDRLSVMFKNAQARVLLSNAPEVNTGFLETIVLELEDRFLFESQSKANPQRVGTSRNLAYIMYTSGSSGSPKGVAVEHRSVVRLVRNTNYTSLSANSKILQLSSFAFDGSVFDIFGALLNGGELHLLDKDTILEDDKLVDYIQHNHINTLFITTALFNNIVELRPACISCFDKLYFGGELCSVKHVEKALRFRKHPASIVHVYGPTESTTFSTFHEIQSVDKRLGTVPIGKPLSNTEVYILDRFLDVVPPGVPGEIYIGGDGLARGYFCEDVLTAQKFIDSPFAKERKLYKTGDLAKWTPDGSIEFMGRKDSQVKIRGHRIELGEIESVLLNHPAIEQAIVDVIGEGSDKELIAYYTGLSPDNADEMKRYLSVLLPEYMVPGTIVRLESFPLNANGKIDRKVLAQNARRNTIHGDGQLPSTETEATLITMWRDLLNKPHMGIHDNFLANGGHSLKALQLRSRINKAFQITIDLKTVYECPTVREMAAYIGGDIKRKYNTIDAIPPREFYDLSYAQQEMWLAAQLAVTKSAYNVSQAFAFKGSVDPKILNEVFATLIHRHEILRTIFKTVDDNPKQFILAQEACHFSVTEIYLQQTEERYQQLEGISEAVFSSAFELDKFPLFDVRLVHMQDDEAVLLLSMHHIISDAWSLEIMKREFVTLYDAFLSGSTNPISPLKIQYKDYAHWQNAMVNGDVLKADRAYWLNELQESIPELSFKSERATTARSSRAGGMVDASLSPTMVKKIQSMADENQTSVFVVMATAYAVLLHHYTGNTDMIIGCPVSGRSHETLEEQIGMYINVLPIRIRFNEEDSFLEVLSLVKKATTEAFNHQQYPIYKLMNDLKSAQGRKEGPLFNVMIDMVSLDISAPHADAPSDPDFLVSDYSVAQRASKFDLTLFVKVTQEQIAVALEYRQDIFSRDSIDRMLHRYQRIFESEFLFSKAPAAQLLQEKKKYIPLVKQ